MKIDKNFHKFYANVLSFLTDNHLNTKCRATLTCFSGYRSIWRIVDDEQAPAPAMINTSTYTVTFNPLLITYSLYELRDELKIVTTKYDWSWRSRIKPLCECIKTFLLLHEVGHWLYTVEAADAVKLARQYCSGYPVQLAMFLLNAVEDSIIQRLFMLEYRGSFYRKCFDLGICIFQGAEAVKTYVSNSESQNWSIKTKLFYFIIRAYNLHNSEVQNMFNIPDKIGWKQDTLDAFDQTIITLDKVDRCRYCFEVLAPLVFRDLTEEVEGDNFSSVGSVDDLLDQDKLYTSKESSSAPGSSDFSDEESSSEDTDTDSEDSGIPMSSNSSSSSSSSSSSNNSSSDSEDSETESEDTDSSGESEGSGDSGDSEISEDTSNSSEGSDTKEDSSERESDTEDSGESSTPGEVEAKEPDQPMTLEQEIIDACNELNNSLNAAKEPTDMSSAPQLKPQANPLAMSCNVVDHTHETSTGSSTSSMNHLTLDIYGNAISVLDKIFTMSESTLRGLDQGELDEDELYTYFTEKNLNIYKEETKLKQDKKVICYFVLDNSGSMTGSRYNYSSAAFIGLIHALEDIQIKCCFLSFGEKVRLIKNFNDSIAFLGTASPLQSVVDKHVSNLEGDTNLYPALDYILSDKEFDNSDPDLCKVVIIATDGCTNNESECASAATKISSESLMFAVGLDMQGEEDYLQRVMPGSQVRIYSDKNIATKLPEDIYEEIINKFLLY